MVKVEPFYFPTVKPIEEEDKQLNPNDLLMSMFNNLTGVEQRQEFNPIATPAGQTEDSVQSLLRALITKSTGTIASPQPFGGKEASSALLEEAAPPSLSALNPNLASALSGILSQNHQKINNCNKISRRKSGPVKLEGPVVPLHIQRHADGQLDLPSNHKVTYNGNETIVPDEIRCHLCNHPMKMCYRKSKYKEEIREYPAYRCLRKGCQTFRAIRKILEPEEHTSQAQLKRKNDETTDPTLRSILSTPAHPDVAIQPFAKAVKTVEATARTENGTLIYVPFSLTPSQIIKFQELAKSIIKQEKLVEEEAQVPDAITVPTSLNESQVKEKMQTEEGRQNIRELIFEGMMKGSAQSLPVEAVKEKKPFES